MKILIVDDHILFREGLANLLNNAPDMEVVGEVGTMHAAIKKTARLKPDVVLIEVDLPDGNGLDAIEPMSRAAPGVNIIILAVKKWNDLLCSAVSRGAKGFILKKASLPELLASLRALDRGEVALSRSMTRDVLEELVWNGTQNQNNDHFNELTPREIEVLTHLSSGLTNREIGEKLVISENTVKVHLYNIFNKLNLDNRREAAKYAKRHGLNFDLR